MSRFAGFATERRMDASQCTLEFCIRQTPQRLYGCQRAARSRTTTEHMAYPGDLMAFSRHYVVVLWRLCQTLRF